MDTKILYGIGAVVGIGGVIFYINYSNQQAAAAAANQQASIDAANANSLSDSSSLLGGTGTNLAASDINPAVYGYGSSSAVAPQPVTGTSSGDASIAALTAALGNLSNSSTNTATTSQAIQAQLQVAQLTNNTAALTTGAQLAQTLSAGNNEFSFTPNGSGGFTFLSANSVQGLNATIATQQNNSAIIASLLPGSGYAAANNANNNAQAISSAQALSNQSSSVKKVINSGKA